MANKQIYELTSRTFNGNSIVPFDVPNTDPSTMADKPYLSGNCNGHDVADFVANTEEFTTDLNTENKKITGAINELHSSIGANTYNSASTYNKGDIVIYNGTLYACNGTSVTGTWDAQYWDATSLQPKTDNTLSTTDKTVVGAINEINAKLNSSGVSGSLTPLRTDIQNWNVSFADLPLCHAYNCFFTFECTGTSQPSITHTWSGNRTITGGNLIAFAIDGNLSGSGKSGTINSSGQLVWNSGIKQGVYVVMGTLTYS